MARLTGMRPRLFSSPRALSSSGPSLDASQDRRETWPWRQTTWRRLLPVMQQCIRQFIQDSFVCTVTSWPEAFAEIVERNLKVFDKNMEKDGTIDRHTDGPYLSTWRSYENCSTKYYLGDRTSFLSVFFPYQTGTPSEIWENYTISTIFYISKYSNCNFRASSNQADSSLIKIRLPVSC